MQIFILAVFVYLIVGLIVLAEAMIDRVRRSRKEQFTLKVCSLIVLLWLPILIGFAFLCYLRHRLLSPMEEEVVR